jgi:Icc-related predicted phosphoesterase
MKIYAMSDAHGDLPSLEEIPKGSVCAIPGDLCPDFIGTRNRVVELQQEWLDTSFRRWAQIGLDRELDLLIAPGNHDFVFEADLHKGMRLPDSVEILINRSVYVEGIGRVTGTPFNFCPNGWAFHTPSEEMMRDHLHYTLPIGQIDLWLCHQPPFGPAALTLDGRTLGSTEIAKACLMQPVKNIVCGHVHEGYGVYQPNSSRPYLLANVAICDISNERVRGWTEIELKGVK